jgi:plasmid stability protein
MPNLTIKNLPREVHIGLKARALRNRRSLNSEIIEILSKATPLPVCDPAKVLAEIAELNRKNPGAFTMTREEIRAAREAGRM